MNHWRELYKEETGKDCYAYIQKFAGDSWHKDGFSDEYISWLEAKIDELAKRINKILINIMKLDIDTDYYLNNLL